MPPRRATRGTAVKKEPTQQNEVKPVESNTSTRASRAAKRAASQAPSEAPQPPAKSDEEEDVTTTTTTTATTTSTTSAKRGKKPSVLEESGKKVENTASIDSDLDEPAQVPTAPPQKTRKTRGKARAGIEQDQPATTRQTRSKKATTEAEPTPTDNGAEEPKTHRNTKKAEAGASSAKREHIELADEAAFEDDAQEGVKLRKVEPGSVSNSRKVEGEQDGPKRRKPRQKKATSPLPVIDPFVEQAAPAEEAQPAAAPKGRVLRGRKDAAAPAEQEEEPTAAELVQSTGRTLRVRKTPAPTPASTTERSSRTKTAKGKTTDADPIAPQNDVQEEILKGQQVDSQIREEATIPAHRGRKPKATPAIESGAHAKEAETKMEAEPTTPAKPARSRRGTQAAANPPCRSARINQPSQLEAEVEGVPETEGPARRNSVAVVIENFRSAEVEERQTVPEAADEVIDEEVPPEQVPPTKKKAAPKRKGGRKPAKKRGKKQAPKHIDSGETQAAEEHPDEHPNEHPDEHQGEKTEEKPEDKADASAGPSDAEPDFTMEEDAEVSQPGKVEEGPVVPTTANEKSQQAVEDEESLLPPILSSPIPAPVVFSASRTTQSFTEPTKSPTPIPSSPLARYSFTSRSSNLGSSKRGFADDVSAGGATPRSSPTKLVGSNPSTPLVASNKPTSFAVDLTTPRQPSQTPTSYTPKATIKHLDVASSPILQPPRNTIDDDERLGKSPVKNATPRSSLDPLVAGDLFGSAESHRWTGSSPRRRLSSGSPVKRLRMSLTDFEEVRSGADDDILQTEDDSVEAATDADSEVEENDEELGQNAETCAIQTEIPGGQVDTEEQTKDAQVNDDGDSEMTDADSIGQEEEDGYPGDVQDNVADESTFNDNSLFAIPIEERLNHGETAYGQQEKAEEATEPVGETGEEEDLEKDAVDVADESTFNDNSLFAIPIEERLNQGETAYGQQEKAEETTEPVGETGEENLEKDAVDQTESLDQPSIDAMKALLPGEVREYYEDTIENLNESTLMLRRDMNDIRNRTPDLGGYYQRSSLREIDPNNISGIFAPGLMNTSASFTFEYSAIQRELEANNSADQSTPQQQISGLPTIQEAEPNTSIAGENEVEAQVGDETIEEQEQEQGEQYDGEDMLPEYLTSPEFSNLKTPINTNRSGPIAFSPVSEGALSAKALAILDGDSEEYSVGDDSYRENAITWDDQSLVEPSGEPDEATSEHEDESDEVSKNQSDENSENKATKRDNSEEYKQDGVTDKEAAQADVEQAGLEEAENISQVKIQKDEERYVEDAVRGSKGESEDGEDIIKGPASKNAVESVTTSQESIFTRGSPKESFSTDSGSFESKPSVKTLCADGRLTTIAGTQADDNLAAVNIAASTPEINKIQKFSLVPKLTPSNTPKRSLADSPNKRGTPNTPNMSLYGMKPEDLPDFEDEFSFLEPTPSDRDHETPGSERRGATTQQHISSSPSKGNVFSSPAKSLVSKLLQEENFEFTDDFSFMENENTETEINENKDGGENFEFTDDFSFMENENTETEIHENKDGGDSEIEAQDKEAQVGTQDGGESSQENTKEKTKSQLDESPGKASPRKPLGEVQVSLGLTSTTQHAAPQQDSPTVKRKVGGLGLASVKRGRYSSSSPRSETSELQNDMNEEISLIDVEEVISDRKYIRPKGRRQSLRLSYLDSAASNTVAESEVQGEVYLTPEKSRFQNLNPLFSACPDSIQAKRRGRRRSLGLRRESLELEQNAHVYTRLQAAIRGFICRQKLEGQKRVDDSSDENRDEIAEKSRVSDLTMAAEVIASAWKGLKQRRAYLAQREAAILIQRAFKRRQDAVNQLPKSGISASVVTTEAPATSVSPGPFDGLLKRFDEKKAAGAAAIPEPESNTPAIQASSYTPRPRRMATQSPVPEKYLYRDPTKYRKAANTVTASKGAEPPTETADNEAESKPQASRAPHSRIPRSGLRPPTATGISNPSTGKRKADDEANEPFAPRLKLTAAQAAAPPPRVRPQPRFGMGTSKSSSSSGIPTTRVVPGNISLVPGSNPFGKRMKESLAKMTQPEINQLTTKHTERNRKYNIDFERQVVRVERDRSSSPDAKTQHRRAWEDRIKRYEIQEETGIVLGPGDPMDYEPEIKTPSKKGVRWHSDLEFGWDEDLEKNSPSAAKKRAKEGIKGIVKKKVPLDPFGNVMGPLPNIRNAPETVVVSKFLYNGEDDE